MRTVNMDRASTELTELADVLREVYEQAELAPTETEAIRRVYNHAAAAASLLRQFVDTYTATHRGEWSIQY